MTTGRDWIERARSYLLSGEYSLRNKLAATYTAGSGTMTLTGDMKGVVPGGRLNIGLNTFYVSGLAGNDVSIIGGQEGTVDVSSPSGSLVWVQPRFTDSDILDSINNEIVDLSGPGNGLFQMKTVDLTWVDDFQGYDLTGVIDLIDVYQVRAQDRGTAKDWPLIRRWRLDRDADSSTFTSGLALQLFERGSPGLKVRVLYRSGFSTLPFDTSGATITGLPVTAYDLPPLGAAISCMVGREIKRNFTERQGDTRRAAEVLAGAVGNSYRGLAMRRDQRIQSEMGRLNARYPDRMF